MNSNTNDERDVYIKKLEIENENLRLNLEYTKKEWATNIDNFVDTWFEENKEEIDLGVIDFRFFKVDVFPDSLEKHIYKKVLKILFSFLTSTVSPH